MRRNVTLLRFHALPGLLALAVVGCKPPPPASAPQKPEIVACSIRGVQRLYASTDLFGEGDRHAVIAHFNGNPIAIELSHLDVSHGARTRAEVRTPLTGPAFVLRGLVELRQLDMYVTRDLSIVPNHAWLAKGARVDLVRPSTNGGAWVHSTYGDFPSLGVDAPCDALGLDTGPRVERQGVRDARTTPTEYMHIAHPGAVLRNATGAPMLEFGRDGAGATVEILETRAGLKHIFYSDGVRLDGFVAEHDLLPGEGPDCDDCHGGIRDVSDKCPDEPESGAEGCQATKARIARALRDTDIHLGAAQDSPTVGRLEQGAEVRVVTPQHATVPSELVSVWPRGAEVEPASEFWVDRSALSLVE
jgi:hypothetical protein